MKRSIGSRYPLLLKSEAVPKDEEIVVDRPHELSQSTKDIAFYERELTKAFDDGRRIVRPDGIGVIVFASKTTASWEAILQAVIKGGWIITGSWPLDTEMGTRVSAQGQARLGSSVHLVVRPREHPDGRLITDRVGDWRDVLAELPPRMHEWMPRLADEGVVGADAIFACLGPALEIFSRYSSVEKANGDPVLLKEYLERVWEAVAKEALALILTGPDATGFEPDARLTVIWFWALKSATTGEVAPETEDGAIDDEEEVQKVKRSVGWQMEYDTVRKLSQGLGVDLEQLSKSGGVVTITGHVATLNSVSTRSASLVGVGRTTVPTAVQYDLFGDPVEPQQKKRKRRALAPQSPDVKLKGVEERHSSLTDSYGEPASGLFAGVGEDRSLLQRLKESGRTTLDRLHQAMLLFGQYQGNMLSTFLVDEGYGRDPRFWTLAQSLAALYPPGTTERRWVEGVLGRKKGLGL